MPKYHVKTVLGNYCESYLNLQRFALRAMMKYVCLRRKIHCNRTTSHCSMFFLVLWTSIYSYLVKKAYSNVEHCVTREQGHDCC